MAVNTQLATLEEQVNFRSAIADMINIAGGICKPGQSVEDFVGVLQLSLKNDLMLNMIIETVKQKQKAT